MSCWCDEVERYTCNPCGKSEKWSRLKSSDKVELIKWSVCVIEEKPEKETSFWPFNNATGLCPLDVPDHVWSELVSNNAAEKHRVYVLEAENIKQVQMDGLEE